jgi:hypothetical protein
LGIKANVSEQEARSGDREPLPVGKYHCAITDVQLDSPSSGDNIGLPMLVFQFTVQDSDLHQPKALNQYVNRIIFVNACCWGADEATGRKGALYTIVNILKAMGKYEECLVDGELDIPDDPDFYLGWQGYVRRATDNNQRKKFPDNPDYWIQAKGFSALRQPEGVGAGASSSSDSSLLP